MAIGAAFGTTRGLSLVPARAIRTPDQLFSFHRRLQGSATTVRVASTSVLAATGLAAGALALLS